MTSKAFYKRGPRRQVFVAGVETDAFAAYDRVGGPRMIHAACWAHARRKFDEAIKLNKQDLVSTRILVQIGKLFAIDAQARDQHMDHARRHKLRLERAWLVLTEIKAQIERAGPTPRQEQRRTSRGVLPSSFDRAPAAGPWPRRSDRCIPQRSSNRAARPFGASRIAAFPGGDRRWTPAYRALPASWNLRAVHSADGFETQQLTVDLDKPVPGDGFGIQSHMPGLVEAFVVEYDLGERAARRQQLPLRLIEAVMPRS